MKPKTLILVVVAVACGLGASYMTARLLAERQPQETEKVEILVARRHLSVGDRIIKPEDLFEIKQVDKDQEPPDAIKDFEQIRGKIMKQSRNKGDHISATNLRSAGEGLDIPAGHQAVGLRVSLEGGAHGFATLPKSRVNLWHTVRHSDPNLSYSHLLLENVLVLGADLRYNADGELAAPAQVVTFALNDKEVGIVNLAKETGIMTLSLRKLDHTAKATERTVWLKDIQPDKREEPKSLAVEVKPEVKPEIVEAPPVPERPKYTRHEVTVVNGAEFGQRQVERVVYFKTEDGRIFYDEPEDFQAGPAPQPQPQRIHPRPAPTPTPTPAVPGTNGRGKDSRDF